jgi:hypothetical protein
MFNFILVLFNFFIKKIMKKVFSFLAMAVVLSLGLNSCGKEDTAEALNVDTSKVAKVTGFATAELDNTNSSEEYVPSGTKVFLKVSYSALSSTAGGGTYLMETTIGANGAFTFENVPVSNDGTTATVTGDQFTYSVKTETAGSETKKFEAKDAPASLNVGSTGYVQLSYTGSTFQ